MGIVSAFLRLFEPRLGPGHFTVHTVVGTFPFVVYIPNHGASDMERTHLLLSIIDPKTGDITRHDITPMAISFSFKEGHRLSYFDHGDKAVKAIPLAGCSFAEPSAPGAIVEVDGVPHQVVPAPKAVQADPLLDDTMPAAE